VGEEKGGKGGIGRKNWKKEGKRNRKVVGSWLKFWRGGERR